MSQHGATFPAECQNRNFGSLPTSLKEQSGKKSHMRGHPSMACETYLRKTFLAYSFFIDCPLHDGQLWT
jgi:hypothetical protein